jgi:fumarate reductase subunit C
MNAPRPYIRPMSGWWWKNPFLLRYMLRELTSLLVAAYAFVLLAGVIALARSEPAYAAWREALQSPWSVSLHAVLLVVFTYHTWSWFEIMPKTLPAVRLAGRRVPGGAITAAGLAAAVACCATLLGTALWLMH